MNVSKVAIVCGSNTSAGQAQRTRTKLSSARYHAGNVSSSPLRLLVIV